MNALEDLKNVMEPYGRELDEPDSIKLIAAVREKGLFSENQWSRVLSWLDSAMQSLCKKEKAATSEVINLDGDARNADWNKIGRARRLSKHVLPSWAALWLWWSEPDEDSSFWVHVGNIAADSGLPIYKI